MNKILVLFAHPLFEKSMVNKVLVEHIPTHKNITFHDLYEQYPDFDIDVAKEQQLLLEHNIIVWHHPMYWYSCPPLLKQWIDMVLEFGWAYGKSGTMLQGKCIFQTITTGGVEENYCATGRNRFTIPDLLQPFNQTAHMCNMHYLPPFVVHGTHRMTVPEAQKFGNSYKNLLLHLLNNTINVAEIKQHYYLNKWFNTLNLSTYEH